MAWTTEQKIKSLMRLPWTVQAEPADDAGEVIVRVAELPGTVVIGTPDEIDAEFWNALKASLECALEFGDEITLPANVKCLPWEAVAAPPAARRIAVAPRNARGSSFTAFSQQVATI